MFEGSKTKIILHEHLQTLKSTTDFEKDLAHTFGEGNDPNAGKDSDSADESDDVVVLGEDENSPSVIRKKYEKKLAEKSGKNAQPTSVNNVHDFNSQNRNIFILISMQIYFRGMKIRPLKI